MAAGRLNLEVPTNVVWRKSVRYRVPAPTRQDPNRRVPMDLTGWGAVFQARRDVLLPLEFSMSTRAADAPNALIPALGPSGTVTWALNVPALNYTDGMAVLYQLVLINSIGEPEPLLEGQIVFRSGVVRL